MPFKNKIEQVDEAIVRLNRKFQGGIPGSIEMEVICLTTSEGE